MKKQTRREFIGNVTKGSLFILSALSINKNLFAEDNPVILGPCLQPTEDLETSVGVAWQMDNNVESIIYYGLQSVEENQVRCNAIGLNTTGNYKHKYYVKLTELLPGSTYKYKIVAGKTTTPEYSFLTSSSKDDFEYRILLISDMHIDVDMAHSRPYNEGLVAEVKLYKPNLVLCMGDMLHALVYGVEEESENFFILYRDILANAIFCPVAGNHDLADVRTYDYSMFTDKFYLPKNGPDGRQSAYNSHLFVKEANYSFNYGGIHFTTLGIGYLVLGGSDDEGDTEAANNYMIDPMKWLENNLRTAIETGKIRNIIGTSHISPIYSARDSILTKRYPETIICTNILDKYKTALIFAGHNHSFQRTYPLDHYGDTSSALATITTQEKSKYKNYIGTIYHTIASPYFNYKVPSWKYFAFVGEVWENVYGTIQVSAGGRKMEVNSYHQGNSIDAYSIERDLQKTSINNSFSNKIMTNSLKSYPNPFNPECYINISGQLSAVSKIKIYNILGQVVRELNVSNGSSSVYWDGRDNFGKELSSGMYFYEMLANNKVQSCRKMLMLK